MAIICIIVLLNWNNQSEISKLSLQISKKTA